MGRRLDLDQILRDLIGPKGHVYYQPPTRLQYPCIKYKLAKKDNIHADNNVYLQSNKYTLTVIDWDPESEIMEKVSRLPRTSFDRHFTFEGLNHFVFTILF